MLTDSEYLKFEEGFYKPLFRNYIEFKRGKGEKVAHSTLVRLRKLNKRLNAYHTERITQQMVTEILAPEAGQSEIERFYLTSSLRQFCCFLDMLGYETVQVPPRYMRCPHCEFRPYIFSDEELSRIVTAADRLPSAHRTNAHKRIYPVLVRILMGTGMRIGEAIALERQDVDCKHGIIKVINGKNNVSRYIPVSESLKEILRGYAEGLNMSEGGKPFFPSSYTEGFMSYDAMKYMFPKIFKAAGITTRDGQKPTIHSIRHTFCTKSLSRMLEDGMDLYTAVPILAAYVGHVNYADTEKYIHFTEQDHEGFVRDELSLERLIPEVANE
jgi:integrase/recombinase XerD